MFFEDVPSGKYNGLIPRTSSVMLLILVLQLYTTGKYTHAFRFGDQGISNYLPVSGMVKGKVY